MAGGGRPPSHPPHLPARPPAQPTTQPPGAPDAWVHLDDDHGAVRGVDGHLHIAAAALHTHLADDVHRGVTQPLVLLQVVAQLARWVSGLRNTANMEESRPQQT